MPRLKKTAPTPHKTIGRCHAPVVTPTWMLRNHDDFVDLLNHGPVLIEDRSNSQLIAVSLTDFVMMAFGVGPSKRALDKHQALREALNHDKEPPRRRKARK